MKAQDEKEKIDPSYALADSYKAKGAGWISEADRFIGVQVSGFDRQAGSVTNF
jgi:hypothetical protein